MRTPFTGVGTALITPFTKSGALDEPAIKRLAKRQMTWMRGQMSDWPRLTGLDPRDHWRQFLALNPGLTA